MTGSCVRCEEPIEGSAVELIRERDGQRVEIHGTCFLKSYSGEAFEEDAPKKWTQEAHSDLSLDEHTERLVDDGAVTYRKGR